MPCFIFSPWLMKQKFPGLRRDFIAAYADLLDRDFFGISDKDPNHLGFPDRINIHYKVGTVQSVVSFDETEEQIIHMTDRAESWEDVLDVVETLIVHMQNDKPEKPSKQSETGDGDGPGGQDEGEEGLAGWVMYLDANDNGQLDEEEVSVTTAGDGSYSFTGLLPGDYIVRGEERDGWKQVTPAPELMDYVIEPTIHVRDVSVREGADNSAKAGFKKKWDARRRN